MTPVAGTVIAERFRLVRPLGKGGMGTVWLADHTSLDVPCAIKFIQSEANDSAEVRRRFEREAKIAAQIRSPHVVQVLDHGVWEESPYIAMELLEGEDLEERIERLGRLGSVETATITAQVARALARAHTAGLVHRDLKPANIFIAHDDDREIIKVLDFGIAKDRTPKIAPGNHTKTGAILGTPAYMSPEQAQGVKRVDHRSDLWSLAVVVFECMTGQLPFQSEAFGDLLLKIMIRPPPVPSSIAPVPLGFDAWWARAIARDPEERFQSAKELSDTLIRALGVSSGDSGVIQLSISEPFSAPGSGKSSAEVRPVDPSDTPTSAPPTRLVEAMTLRLPTPEPHMKSAPEVIAAALLASGADELSAGRPPRPQTAGPVSTSLSSRAAPPPRSWRAGRIALAVIAGSLVAAGGALLLLRRGEAGVSNPSTVQQLSAIAEPPAQQATAASSIAPPPADTLAPAPADTLAPAPTGVQIAPAPAVTSVPAVTATSMGTQRSPAISSAPRARGTTAPAATPTSTAGPQPTGPTKTKGPKDFGI